MQDMLLYIIKGIVTVPDQVKVEETVDETGTTNYVISVDPTDVGRLIGKEGKVIKAIRTIMRVIAIQKGVHVRISVLSDEVGSDSEVAVATDEVAPQATESDSLSVEV